MQCVLDSIFVTCKCRNVSYLLILLLLTPLANMLISTYRERNIICPPNMKKYLVTGICFDKIDKNTKSKTSKSTFHGTAITTNQLSPVKNDDGDEETQGIPLSAVYKNSITLTVESLPQK